MPQVARVAQRVSQVLLESVVLLVPVVPAALAEPVARLVRQPEPEPWASAALAAEPERVEPVELVELAVPLVPVEPLEPQVVLAQVVMADSPEPLAMAAQGPLEALQAISALVAMQVLPARLEMAVLVETAVPLVP